MNDLKTNVIQIILALTYIRNDENLMIAVFYIQIFSFLSADCILIYFFAKNNQIVMPQESVKNNSTVMPQESSRLIQKVAILHPSALLHSIT